MTGNPPRCTWGTASQHGAVPGARLLYAGQQRGQSWSPGTPVTVEAAPHAAPGHLVLRTDATGEAMTTIGPRNKFWAAARPAGDR